VSEKPLPRSASGFAGSLPSVRLRRATVDDASDVAAVYIVSRQEAAPYMPRSRHTSDEIRNWIASIVLVEQDVWVAVVDDRIVGIAVLRGDFVDQFYVLPEHQRRGVGTQLLVHVKRQRRVLRLYTFQSNQPARAFYEKHGFTAVAFGDGTGNEEGEPDVLYEWRAYGRAARTPGRMR
jgi:ribosomal protein S18 acetylase RimI-like enzyme